MSFQSPKEDRLKEFQQTVEDLRLQSKLERVAVSVTAKSLMDYVNENQADDPLINPMAKNENPFVDSQPATVVKEKGELRGKDKEQFDQAELSVTELKQHIKINREMVSASCKSLITFVKDNEADDFLVTRRQETNNPFAQKDCIII